MTEEEWAHHPEGRGKGEVLRPLAAPGIEAEGAEPLVDGGGDGGGEEAGEDGRPQLVAEGNEKGQKRDVRFVGGRRQTGDARVEEGHGKVDCLGNKGKRND